MVCFRIAVPVPAYIELINILLHPLKVFPGLFGKPLEICFSFPAPVDKNDSFFLTDLIQFSDQHFYGPK